MKQKSLLIICFFALLTAYCHNIAFSAASLSAQSETSSLLKILHEETASLRVCSMLYSLFVFLMVSTSLAFGNYADVEGVYIYIESAKIIVIVYSLFVLNTFTFLPAIFVLLEHVL